MASHCDFYIRTKKKNDINAESFAKNIKIVKLESPSLDQYTTET